MSLQILLHRQKLSESQRKKLEAGGVVAIRTDDPSQFKLVDTEIPCFEMDDMVWALITAISEDGYGNTPKLLVKNLAKLASESRERRSNRHTTNSGEEA